MASHIFDEYDEGGILVARYSASSHKTGTTDGRLDRIASRSDKTLWQQLLDVFLPAGYPSSVSDDYTAYQIYDSLQAFSSSIAGLLASRAVLEGVGVGDAKASPTAALLLSTLQESMGRVATILFAHRLGTALEPECKMYRLLADIFNDAAMILDCLSPAFPMPVRVLVLSSSSVLRALCGVAAGSAKASLSAHFAQWGNLGELNAKDSSQETVISLVGMLVGSVVVSWVTTPATTWVTLLLLLALHLGTNHAAVRAVKMTSFNRQRCNILFSTLIETGEVLTPGQVSARERIFETDRVLRWSLDDAVVGHCSLGVSLVRLVEGLSEPGQATTENFSSKSSSKGSPKGSSSLKYRDRQLSQMLSLFQADPYLLSIDARTRNASIVLMQGAGPTDQLRAWVHALWACRIMDTGVDSYLAIREAKTQTEQLFLRHSRAIAEAGWHLEAGVALQTRSGVRLGRAKLD